MKVTRIETLRCDAGWRMFSFLKVMTDDGLIGWSEYNESFGSHGLSGVIEALSPVVIGKDPRDIELINCHLRTQTVQSRGGINRQAVAAIENALLDIKGKALGVPVTISSAVRYASVFRSTGRTAGVTARAIRSSSACQGSKAMTICRVSPKK